jgi:uncharacterized protein (DUF488 family)
MIMGRPKIITIGVYGFSETSFFEALVKAKVDTFCDIRMRRALRGSLYAFANSQHLQNRLNELGIKYLHLIELAPSQEIINTQKRVDKKSGIGQRKRTLLSPEFIDTFKKERLDQFKVDEFLAKVGEDARCVALFCVEREPAACHRSLVAQRLKDELGLEVEHILPQS